MGHLAFGTPERAVLLALMALGGSASNPELRERFGATLDGARRRRMADLGLVKGEKRQRGAYHFELTEAGWAWCAEELSEAPPERAGSLGRALYCVLPLIQRYLDRTDLSLGEFAAADPADPADPAERSEGGDVEALIRTAYWKLASRPQEWVRLTDVRPLLEGAPRAEVDAVLKRMEQAPDVHLAPEADQKTLTDTDREAAVRVGGKDQHLLAIEAR